MWHGAAMWVPSGLISPARFIPKLWSRSSRQEIDRMHLTTLPAEKYTMNEHPGYRGSEEKTQQLPAQDKDPATAKTLRANAVTTGTTAPQLNKIAEYLKRKMESGQLPEGNVELAALLGFQPAQIALGRRPDQGMTPGQLIQFLLEDPNLKVSINVSGP